MALMDSFDMSIQFKVFVTLPVLLKFHRNIVKFHIKRFLNSFNCRLFLLGKPTPTILSVFSNIVQKAFDPPPLVLNMYVANFFKELLKKCVNVCPVKNRQNKA